MFFTGKNKAAPRRAMIYASAIACAVILYTPLAIAEEPSETPAITQERLAHVKMFEDGQYAALDHAMNDAQLDYESGHLNELDLSRLFRLANPDYPDSSMEKNYNAWIAAFPHSYAAYHTRGSFYRHLAWQARGVETIQNTPKENIDRMEQYASLSMKDYETAMTLTKKPYLTYADIIELAQLNGDDALAAKMVRLADDIDARNYIANFHYLHTLRINWGGSINQMIAFRDKVAKAGLSADLLQEFDDVIAEEEQCRCLTHVDKRGAYLWQ